MPTPAGGSSTLFQSLLHIRARHFERRNQPEQKSGSQRNSQRKEKDTGVESNVFRARQSWGKIVGNHGHVVQTLLARNTAVGPADTVDSHPSRLLCKQIGFPLANGEKYISNKRTSHGEVKAGWGPANNRVPVSVQSNSLPQN